MGEILGINAWWFLAIIPFILATVIIRVILERKIIDNAVVMTTYGLPGEKIANAILREAELDDVDIQQVGGTFEDEYEIRSKTIKLSPLAMLPNSVTAAAIATMVTGHALMHSKKNPLLVIRSVIVVIARFSAILLLPFIVFGLLLSYPPFVKIGIIYYVIATALQFITIFVDVMAAKSGISVLKETGMITDEEMPHLEKLTKSMALMNEAALATSLTYLIRFVLNIGSGRSTRG